MEMDEMILNPLGFNKKDVRELYNNLIKYMKIREKRYKKKKEKKNKK